MEQKTERLQIRITPTLHQRLQDEASRSGSTMADVVNRLLDSGLAVSEARLGIGLTSHYDDLLDADGNWRSEGWVIQYRDAFERPALVVGRLEELHDRRGKPSTMLKISANGRAVAIPRVRLDGWTHYGQGDFQMRETILSHQRGGARLDANWQGERPTDVLPPWPDRE